MKNREDNFLILFCEYVIPEEHRAAFTAWVQSDTVRWQGITLYENTSQPGVYVEIYPVTAMEEAAEIEKERREGRSWSEMVQWVKGGKNGLRLWTFRQVELNE